MELISKIGGTILVVGMILAVWKDEAYLAKSLRYSRDSHEIENTEQSSKVDIVRCKDCKHWDNRFGLTDTDGSCEKRGETHNLTDAGYYCASGERKEE